MDIKYDDDIPQCRYCGRYGHLLRQCRSKAADDKQHQRVRDEALALRTTDWQTAREKLAAEYHQEAKELRRHLNEKLTASADVFIAAKLALEGQDNCAEQQAHLQQVFNDDHDTINRHASDAAEFLADEVYEKIGAIDNKFQKSGGHIPDESTVNRLMVTPSIKPETEEIAPMNVEMLIRTESRFTNQLQHHLAIAATNQQTRNTQYPPNRPTITPPSKIQKTSPAPPSVPPPIVPFQNLTAKQQGKLINPSKKSLPSNFDYKTHCQYIIQLKTPTTHITSLIRTHLFNIKRRPGYEYMNPLETEICTSDTDDTSRIIYVLDVNMANHLVVFLKKCRDDK